MIALVTGAASSGKSAWAENLAVHLAAQNACQLVYLATMQPFGEDGARRIARHRKLRAGKGFATIEAPQNLAQVNVYAHAPASEEATSASKPVVLLEDLGNLVANELFNIDGSLNDAALVSENVRLGLEALACQCAHIVVVTDEIAADGIAYPTETLLYQELLGSCACAVAARANLVAEVVCGQANILKNDTEDARA